MNFRVQQGDFLKELQLAHSVVERKTTIPILSSVLLETAGDKIRLVATDLDVFLECICPATIKADGSGVVSAKKLFEIVRNLPSDAEIGVRMVKDSVEIACKKSRFKLVATRKDSFPVLPAVADSGCRLRSADMAALISRVLFAVDDAETRYAQNGALFNVRAEAIEFVATDGHRLAVATMEKGPVDGRESSSVIPSKALRELQKLLVDYDGEIDYSVGEQHMWFTIGERTLISRRLAGEFPKYNGVIPEPQDTDKQVVIDSEALTNALRRGMIMADDRSHCSKLSFKQSELIVSSQREDGDAEDTVACEYVGEPLEIGFNAKYILEFLDVVNDPKVTARLTNPDSQAVFAPATNTKVKYLYVVMPMHI